MSDATTGRIGATAAVGLCLLAAACSTAATDTGDEATAAPSSTVAEPTTAPAPAPAPETTTASTTASTAASTTPADGLGGSIDVVLATLGEARIAAFGGIECAEELVLLLSAIDRYEANTGRVPDDADDVEAAMGGPLERWSWEGGAADPRPQPGSGCSADGFDPADPAEEDAGSVCSIERRTIETAVETFRALDPSAEPPEEDELVGVFIQEPSDRWDLDGWDVVPAPGSICDPR